MAKKKAQGYFAELYVTLKESLSSYKKVMPLIAAIDILSVLGLLFSLELWKNRMIALSSVLEGYDPEHLLSGTASEAQLDGAVSALQTTIFGMLAYVLGLLALVIIVITATRYFIWLRVFEVKEKPSLKGYWSFVRANMLIGVLGAIFLSYPILGISKLSPTLQPDQMMNWGILFAVFLVLYQFFKLHTFYNHLVSGEKIVRSVGAAIKNGFATIHKLALPGLIVMVPFFFLPTLEARLLSYTGVGLHIVRVGTMILILMWGRFFYAAMLKKTLADHAKKK